MKEHAVTITHDTSPTLECFVCKEEKKLFQMEVGTTFPRGHTDKWLGHCQKLTESEVSVYSPGSKVHLFIFGGGTHTYHWMCGSQDTTCRYWFLFPPHGSLGSNSGGQGDNKGLYSLSRLSSPRHLVLKAM